MGNVGRFLIGALVVALFALAAFGIWSAQPPSTLRLAAGNATGARGKAGAEIKQILAKSGVKVQLIKVDGGNEGRLNALSKPLGAKDAADVSFVQSGWPGAAERKGIANLGSIYLEPIWVFGRNLPPGNDIQRLRGARLAGGASSAKQNGLLSTLLAENGMDVKKDVIFVPLSGNDSATALVAGKVDAVWMAGGVNSPWVHKLLEAPGVELIAFDRSAAYARKHSFLVDMTLAKGVISLQKNVPDRDVRLVGPTSEVIIRDSLHPALQALLLDAMRQAFTDGDEVSAPGMFPNKDLIDIPLSQEARRYYESGPTYFRRVLPFWAANFAERAIFFLIPLITLLVPLFQFVPPFLNWRIKARINKWYHQLRLLETKGLYAKDPEEQQEVRDKLESLIDQVSELKVPLDFADDAYRLRAHMRFVLDALQRRAPRSV
jgi:NMT1/THI5 like